MMPVRKIPRVELADCGYVAASTPPPADVINSIVSFAFSFPNGSDFVSSSISATPLG